MSNGPVKQKKGFVLLPVVLAITLIASIAFLINRESAMQVNMTAKETDIKQARYVAEAGYQHTYWQLQQSNCSAYSDFPDTTFGNDSYNVKITDSSGATLTSGSPVNIVATGTLANGTSQVINRNNIAVYQPIVTKVIQPDATAGKDSFIEGESGKTNQNNGTDANLKIDSETNKNLRTLLQFDLSGIPADAIIQSAILELYVESSVGNDDVVKIHRMTQDWNEAEVTWNNYDTANTWSVAGGDYAITETANVLVDGIGWKSVDITTLTQNWHATLYDNNGVVLLANASTGNNEKTITSSDDTNPALHPKLTINYACECGQTCTMAASEKIILSTKNDATLASLSFTENDLVEYDTAASTATLYPASSPIDPGANTNALHVLENGRMILSTHTDTTFGGLSFNNDDLVEYDPVEQVARLFFDGTNLFQSGVVQNVNAVFVKDNGHIILSTDFDTQLGGLSFSKEDLVDYDPVADTATLLFDGSALFTDTGENINAVHILENDNIVLSTDSNASLGGLSFKKDALVEYNLLTDSATIYFDEKTFDTDHQNIDAIHIGDGSGTGLPVYTPVAYWKLDESTGTTAVDSVGGHDGTLVNGPVWNSSGQVDGALSFDGVDDHVTVPHHAELAITAAITISAWVKNEDSSLSGSYRVISKEQSGQNDAYWMAMSGGSMYVGIGGDIFTPSTSFLANQWYHLAMTFDDAADELRIYVNGVLVLIETTTTQLNTNTAEVQIGNNWEGTKQWLGLLDDVRIYDQALAESEIDAVMSSGGGGGSGGSCNGYYLDRFDSKSFSNDDGTLSWPGPWEEVGESDGPTSGDIQVTNDFDIELRIVDSDNGGEGVQRQADLAGAASATLSFEYSRIGLDDNSDYVAILASSTGTSGPWTELHRFEGPGTDYDYYPYTLPLDSYISSNTAIRIISSPSLGWQDSVWFDEIKIECSP